MSFMKNCFLNFCTCSTLKKEIPTNIKGKNVTAQNWITRQLNDPYIKSAKIHNFRCRSAFKLLDIDEKYNILKPGFTVIDCGAAPGSWSQVAAAKTNSNKKYPGPVGRVIGIDKLNIFPIEGVTILNQYDLNSPESLAKIIELLKGDKVDVVLSDIAPNATGMKEMDHYSLVETLYKILKFAVLNTKIDGTCVMKLWSGNRLEEFEKNIKKFYANVRFVKPPSSRSDSAEIYIVARNFRGIQTNNEQS